MTTLRAKVVLEGEMKVLTGLHVGSAAAGLQIGSIDAPVVRDPVSRYPYIPGSSLKGKLRSLVEASKGLQPNREGGRDIKRHECDDRADALDCPVCRVFGSTGKESGNKNHPARLIVSGDLLLTEDSEKKLEAVDTGLMYTEWKFENTLDRITSAAMPRQIERIPAGAVFGFRLIYDEREEAERPEDDFLNEDIRNLLTALRLLEDDALGGHGSRGYGRVKFEDLRCSKRTVEEYGAGEPFDNGEPTTLENLLQNYQQVRGAYVEAAS